MFENLDRALDNTFGRMRDEREMELTPWLEANGWTKAKVNHPYCSFWYDPLAPADPALKFDLAVLRQQKRGGTTCT